MNAQSAAWYASNKEHVSHNQSEYYKRNKEQIDERNRRLYAANKDSYDLTKRIWRLNNPDRMRKLQREWKNTLRGYLKAKLHRLRTRTAGITPCNLTFEQLEALYYRQSGLCVLTGRQLCLKGKHSLDSLSIDRKNQKKGYTIRNIRLVTWQANSARNSGSDAQLVAFCRDVLKCTRRKAG